ncbi:SLATT domain-containing protein [Cytobacillus gottheilii]|uniref:SLATT domain-containing protein n=1 Tax=Cytobacillus gottheilii TaxID=859144 RepID=A0ABX8FBJ1_9BACI|nr:SLATT domain-containing protein [Cytobacillus gottheilii]QVY61564.1 SLATT domain-containing protein [Cytobacillus gottheilii]
MNKIPYKERDILFEIDHKIYTFNKTRNNKIKQSLRLEKYTEMWKLITFILNIEAVIFVILSIGAKNDSVFDNDYFVIISSVFSIYVILIQYYISEQRYGERALKAHYQQLHIEDLILSLKNLLIMNNSIEIELKGSYLTNEFNRLIYEYQTILKNNENHSPIDFLLASEEETGSKLLPKDFTKDNVMIYSNLIFCVLIPLIIIIVLIFT